jgi:DNA-3-methyladenine glycosylase
MTPRNDIGKNAVFVAQRLLGSWLVRELDGQVLVGKIVETEAYEQADAASHSFKGKTPRTEVLFGPPDHAYVYFTYGMHYCVNVVTGKQGEGSAVLIRALEPLEGLDAMRARRPRAASGVQLTNGPAKLCQAMDITRHQNGHDLQQPPLQLVLKPRLHPEEIMQTTRIGITRDTHRPWRFYVRGSPFISRP